MFRYKNIITGYLYFYIHLIVEIVCFYYLGKHIGYSSFYTWVIPLMYDAFAFVPQSIIGIISDKYPKIKIGLIGIILMFIAVIVDLMNINVLWSLIPLCLGNCFIHISGAEVTLKTSDGKLSHSAIFVAGGSFGVILGKLLAETNISSYYLLIPILSMIPVYLLGESYKTKESNCNKFNYVNTKINPKLIILLMALIVIVRGYIGYGIPTSWNKTVVENIIFYFTMGIGKAMGGILSDYFGIKKVAIFSILLSIPFLCFGNNIMMISIIGVMLFSMTMSITLGSLVSVLKRKPGLAFGITTISLFLGTLPIFFIKITSFWISILSIIFISVICALIMNYVLRGENNGNNI